MLTKETVLELLQSSNDIMNYESMQSNLLSGKLTSISSDDALWVMIKALAAYGEIVKYVVDELE